MTSSNYLIIDGDPSNIFDQPTLDLLKSKQIKIMSPRVHLRSLLNAEEKEAVRAIRRRQYYSKPEVQEKRKEYYKREDVKHRREEYNQRPEIKEKKQLKQKKKNELIKTIRATNPELYEKIMGLSIAPING
jgi:hypothetical protein